MKQTSPTIFLTAEDTCRLSALTVQLQGLGSVYTVCSQEKLLKAAGSSHPDLILIDAYQSARRGISLCKKIKEYLPLQETLVIVLKEEQDQDSHSDPDNWQKGQIIWMEQGEGLLVYDQPHELQSTIKQLVHQTPKDWCSSPSHQHEMMALQEVFIQAMASLAEVSYDETGNHIIRTQYYVKALAKWLAEQGHFPDILTQENIEFLSKSALVHDIGKVGIPEYIMMKPGVLTQEEFEIMKTHTTLGLAAIERAERLLGSGAMPYSHFAKEIVLSHHERWDGTGYPQGLKGEEIPLSARLMALADVYDALTSKRVYKDAYSHERARCMILKSAGEHFDPLIVEAFENLEGMFMNIANCYANVK